MEWTGEMGITDSIKGSLIKPSLTTPVFLVHLHRPSGLPYLHVHAPLTVLERVRVKIQQEGDKVWNLATRSCH